MKRFRAATIPAHEFHYAGLENLDRALRFAYHGARQGHGPWPRRHRARQSACELLPFASDPRNPWVDRFVSFVRMHRRRAADAASSFSDAPVELHL